MAERSHEKPKTVEDLSLDELEKKINGFENWMKEHTAYLEYLRNGMDTAKFRIEFRNIEDSKSWHERYLAEFEKRTGNPHLSKISEGLTDEQGEEEEDDKTRADALYGKGEW